jgi:type III restriction enzyme
MVRDENIYERPIKLRSEFIRRKVERSSLSGEFKQCFLEAAAELKLQDNINANVTEVQRKIKTDGRVKNINVAQTVQFEKEYAYRLGAKQISDEYGDFVARQTRPYMPKRSANFIKSSIRSWFKTTYDQGDEDRIAQIVIQGNNRPKFLKVIEVAKDKYGQLPTREDEVVTNLEWQVPDGTTIFKSHYVELPKSKKSILKEKTSGLFFINRNSAGKADLSSPETRFIDSLEDSDSETQWWFRNGTKDSKYFSIAYKKPSGFAYGFYPDFIIKTKKEVLIVEVKDDASFSTDNFLKLRSGKEYARREDHHEKVRLYLLSPDDFDGFFRHIKNQELDLFTSLYEDRLLRWARSSQVVLQHTEEKSSEDTELLDYYEQEFAKLVHELEDTQLQKELLEIDLQQAKENLKAIGSATTTAPAGRRIEITKPFNLCILGEVTDEALVVQELQAYFAKHSLSTNDWSVKFVNNLKLQNADVLRSLQRGKSKFDLIVTGQIHHHAGKGNSKANLLSELKNEKYIPHLAADPRTALTPSRLLESLEEYFNETPPTD